MKEKKKCAHKLSIDSDKDPMGFEDLDNGNHKKNKSGGSPDRKIKKKAKNVAVKLLKFASNYKINYR